MSNILYDHGRDAFLNGSINYTSDTIKMVLVTSLYVVDLANHQFFTDLGANTIGTPQALASKSSSAGIANCAAVVFTAVTTGSTVIAFVLYKDTNTGSTSPLIAYIDTLANGSVSIPTNGSNITVNIDTGANKLFKL